MTHKEELRAPAYVNFLATLSVALLFIIGQFRDLFYRRPSSRKGYATVTDNREDFYNRRLYKRIHDCWNRPIASAPGGWIDVMERECIRNRSMSLRPDKVLEPTGKLHRCLNLGSYNYLGFAAQDEYCTPRVLDTLHEWGVSTCSSRVEAGTTPLHLELEATVARFLNTEAAITYGMGFATNSSSIPLLCGKGTLVLSDALNHSSIVAGIKAGGAKVKVFRHNDVAHLEKLLRYSIAEGQPRTRRPWKKVVIIVEGIYSMEGESCPLAAIVALKKRYKAYLYLDEAHSIGAMGGTGRGVCEAAGVEHKDVDILMGTFTKSFGSCGGYIAGSKALIEHLKRYSPAHLHASAMAPGAAQQIISALQLMLGEDGSDRGQRKVRQLHDNADYFRRRLVDMGLHVLGDYGSPVLPIMLYHCNYLSVISRVLYDRHIAMVVVGFPATPLLLCRARVCISAAHTREDLDYALDAIEDVTRALGMQYDGRQRAIAQKAQQQQQEGARSSRSGRSISRRGGRSVRGGRSGGACLG